MNDNNSAGLRDKAAGLAGTAKQQANSLFESKKSTALSEVTQLADALRRVGSELQGSSVAGSLINTAADRLQAFGSGMENRSLSDLKDDVELFARRNPAAFLGGALVLGAIAARFLKSHGPARPAGFYPEVSSSRYAANDIETPFASTPASATGSDFGISGGSGISGSGMSSGSGISGSSTGTTSSSSGLIDDSNDRGGIR
ncbi:MAG TPA: hypothetical protein VF111_03450 [Thermoanaerobaculia bacterium]